jgi:hypothetical protein
MVEVHEKITPLTCEGFLEFWDDEVALDMVEKKDGYWYHNDAVVGCDTDELEAFYRALFIDRTVKLYVWCNFYITSDYCAVGVANDYVGLPSRMDKRTGIRAPSLAFDDLGDYGWGIKSALERGSIEAAYQLCDRATRSINIHDSVVFGRFLDDIFNNYDLFPIFELPDGSQVDIDGAVDWAIAQQSTQE